MPAYFSDSMWQGLAFLAVHERWRHTDHQPVVAKSTMTALWRRGFADMYHDRSEAWILPPGRDFLDEQLEGIVVEFSLPDTDPDTWRRTDALDPGLAKNRLSLANRLLEIQHRLCARHGGRVDVRPVFIRKEAQSA
jgi:hypothetical protein